FIHSSSPAPYCKGDDGSMGARGGESISDSSINNGDANKWARNPPSVCRHTVRPSAKYQLSSRYRAGCGADEAGASPTVCRWSKAERSPLVGRRQPMDAADDVPPTSVGGYRLNQAGGNGVAVDGEPTASHTPGEAWRLGVVGRVFR
ncbi:MAG: hypothetical protein MI867_04025, partial [Pseudomonadales bacterium]|nr:hypothetical protein [Pseudomonadales bacterium]